VGAGVGTTTMSALMTRLPRPMPRCHTTPLVDPVFLASMAKSTAAAWLPIGLRSHVSETATLHCAASLTPAPLKQLRAVHEAPLLRLKYSVHVAEAGPPRVVCA
jgi:hypothetical protein